jgi:PAS domain S-box-containing protein
MSLRKKTLLLIGLTLVGLVALLYTSSRTILLDSYARLEEQDVQQHILRTESLLADELANLRAVAWNWASWDDTYHFVEDADQGFIDAYFNEGAFQVYRLNLILLVNTDGEAVFARAYDLTPQQVVPVPRSLNQHLTTEGLLLDPQGERGNVTGLVVLPEGALVVAAQPIRPRRSEEASRGTLILGRYLEADRLEHRNTGEQVSFSAASAHADGMGLAAETPMLVEPMDEQSVAGYTLINDIYGSPGIILNVEIPRSAYQQGQTSLSYLLLSLVVVGVASGVVTLVLLERLVLARVAKLNQGASRIASSGDLTARLPVVGKDELCSLSGSMNAMLDALQQSQDNLHRLNTELEGRVAERTAELENKNALLQAILDTMGEGVIYTTDGEIHYVNQALAEMTGFQVEELVGQPDTMLQKSTVSNDKGWLITARLADAALERGELVFRRKDESRLTVAVTATRVTLGDRRGRVAIVRDITQEKELEERQKRFISSASHELRTPVTNFNTRLYLLRNQPEKQDEHLDVLQQTANRLKRLIEDLLDVSRFQQGTMPLERQDVVLQSLAAEVIRAQEPDAEAKHIGLKVDFPAAPLHLLADPHRIIQVITNLVTNAIHYTPEGGLITVQLATDPGNSGSCAIIRVRDNGDGIAPEHLPNVFQPFYRAGQNGKNGGAGLGLTITREIVELHGGSIGVDSEAGLGSTFTVRLPLVITVPHNDQIIGQKAQQS